MEARNETQLTNYVVKQVEKLYPGIWVLKVHGGGYQRAGVPDLLMSLHGRLIAVEMKHRKPGESVAALLGRVSERQHVELDRLKRSGARTLVAWTLGQVTAVLDEIMDEDAELDN